MAGQNWPTGQTLQTPAVCATEAFSKALLHILTHWECPWMRRWEHEVEMENYILNIYVLSRCGSSGFFVFNIKTLELAPNHGLHLAWDIKLLTTMSLVTIKSLSLLCSVPKSRICNSSLMFFFLQTRQILTLVFLQMSVLPTSWWKILNIRPLELG